MLNLIRILLSSLKKTYLIWKKNPVNYFNVYLDMVYLCYKYKFGTNNYLQCRFWELSKEDKIAICSRLKKQRVDVELWWREYFKNRKFLLKYSDFKYETSWKMIEKRQRAYVKQYGLPESFSCQYGVKFIREHNGYGKIVAGENLCIARDVDIDLTGDITFGNDVNISEGAKFLTHAHDYDNVLGKEIISSDMAYVTPLVVGDDVHFGARCIILPGCNHIGSHSFIGAAAVVTHDVPDWAVVAGNPAKVIKMRAPQGQSNEIN